MAERASWGFEEGDEIVPGRVALRRLGGGTRFEVYLGLDDRLAATIVVKLLRPDQTGDRAGLRALANEADVLARLSHPTIVRSFGAVLDGERPHLVLEHLEGPTLRRLIRKHGPLPAEQIVPLAVHLSSALHYMAAEGYVHLDVKPANVVMDLTPRLVDLSVARTAERARTITSPVGTPATMSPEQCDPTGRGPIGPAADVWGLGATLYRALTGTRPFPGEAGAYPQLTSDPEPFPGRVPRFLGTIVLSCLEKDPSRRPAPLEIASALEPALAALPRKPALGRRRPKLT